MSVFQGANARSLWINFQNSEQASSVKATAAGFRTEMADALAQKAFESEEAEFVLAHTQAIENESGSVSKEWDENHGRIGRSGWKIWALGDQKNNRIDNYGAPPIKATQFFMTSAQQKVSFTHQPFFRLLLRLNFNTK